MKPFLSKVLLGTMLVTFLFVGYCPETSAAPITKTLGEDTKITPPGVMAIIWISIPEFKQGTTVALNENGEVLEGILTSTERLPYVRGAVYYPRVINFKAGTKVIFNNRGEVIKGTVDELTGIPISETDTVMVKAGGEISFHENGMLATFFPAFDIYLRSSKWQQNLTASYTNKVACPGFIEFKGWTLVELNEKGEVVKGTLNKATKLLSPSGIKLYEAGTTVEFDENGVVVKASK